MPETFIGTYGSRADAEAAANELAQTGLEGQLVTLERTASALDLGAIGYAEKDPLTSGQAAAWGALVGAVLGIAVALLCLWIFPRGYRGAGPLLVAGPWPTLFMGALLGAIGGSFAGTMASARPPKSLLEAREQVQLTVRAPDAQAPKVLETLRLHHPLRIEEDTET